MNRRQFLYQSFAAGALASGIARAADNKSDVVIERDVPGKPHAGKVLAAIQPHADDLAIFAGGTLAKLLNEGYTGYMIRSTNDDMAGRGTIAETALANEHDVQDFVKLMGLKGNFSLNYGNHEMDAISKPEMRSRLIFLFRLLKVDTVLCYDPWGTYEENPDHYVTAQCVEAACWMAGGDKDYPEHFAAGLKPHGVSEKYYFARGPQLVNRIVDISSYVRQKIEGNLVNKTQGPAGKNGSQLRASLSGKHMRLPLLGNDDATADNEYIREFLLRPNRAIGAKYGLQYAEEFHYIGRPEDEVGDYVKKNAVRE